MKTPPAPVSQSNPPRRIWQTPAICLALAVLIAAVYAPVRHFEFLNYDDDLYITANPTVQAGLTPAGFRWAMTANEIGHWHPLTWLSHMADCEWFGMHAGGHHVVNVLLHAATTVLLFLVLRRMTGGIWPAAFAAALFAFHPQRVESVAWIAERKDVLSGLFFVLTLGSYERYVRHSKSGGWYAVTIVLFALGLLSKGMLVTLPFVLLLLDYWPLQRFDSSTAGNQFAVFKRLVVEKLPLFLLSAASCVVTSMAPEIISSGARWTLAFRFENAVVSYILYVWQMLVPVGLAVPYLAPTHGAAWWQVAGALGLLAALSWIAIWQRRQRPYLIVGWLWYLGMTVPVIGLIQISYYARADRYTYLPLIGPAIAIAWLVKDLAERRVRLRPVLTVVGGAIVAALLLRTADQVLAWRNNFTLWQHTLKCLPGNAYAHNNLGIALAEQGKTAEAIEHYQAAVSSKPDFILAHNNLGNALLKDKKVTQAIVHFRQALRIDPALAPSHYNLGNALRMDGNIEEAFAEYQRAIELKPDFALAWNNLGNLQLSRNRIVEAIAAYREALRLEPNATEYELNLGKALLKQGDSDEAIVHLSKGLSGNPSEADAHLALADALLQQGRLDEAAVHCTEALRLKPELDTAHFQTAKVLSRQGRIADAIDQYETVLKLQPANPEAHNNLGNLLATTGRTDDAMQHYQEALRLQPDKVEAHNNYAGLLLQGGRIGEAIAQYQDALRLNPKFVPALRNLVWIRAACADVAFRDGHKALELARQAVEITDGRDAASLDALAAAQAEDGRFAEAIETATKARALLANQPALMKALDGRIALYHQSLPYRMTR